MATHPDLVGGLQFVSLSVRAFLAAELRYQHERRGRGGLPCSVPGQLFFSFIYVIAAVVILNLLLFAAPLLVFGGKLVEARRRGIIDYGGLAESGGTANWKKSGSMTAKVSMRGHWTCRIFPPPPIFIKLFPTSIK